MYNGTNHYEYKTIIYISITTQVCIHERSGAEEYYTIYGNIISSINNIQYCNRNTISSKLRNSHIYTTPHPPPPTKTQKKKKKKKQKKK